MYPKIKEYKTKILYLIIYVHISNGETGLMGEIESNNLRIALKRREKTTLYVGN